jgi:hypothetical protein
LLQRPDIDEWKASICDLLSRVDLHRVVNCDETAWAPVGVENVDVCIDASDKEAITVLWSITAAYEKFPLFIIAKGLTARVETSQLGTTEGHETSHSPSGRTMTETFHQYLHWLRAHPGDAEMIDLILDCFTVHRSRERLANMRNNSISNSITYLQDGLINYSLWIGMSSAHLRQYAGDYFTAIVRSLARA